MLIFGEQEREPFVYYCSHFENFVLERKIVDKSFSFKQTLPFVFVLLLQGENRIDRDNIENIMTSLTQEDAIEILSFHQ